MLGRTVKACSMMSYVGNRHERVRGDRYYDFVDQFVQTAETYSLICIFTLKILAGAMLLIF